jgi:hypothetical protein
MAIDLTGRNQRLVLFADSREEMVDGYTSANYSLPESLPKDFQYPRGSRSGGVLAFSPDSGGLGDSTLADNSQTLLTALQEGIRGQFRVFVDRFLPGSMKDAISNLHTP